MKKKMDLKNKKEGREEKKEEDDAKVRSVQGGFEKQIILWINLKETIKLWK